MRKYIRIIDEMTSKYREKPEEMDWDREKTGVPSPRPDDNIAWNR